MLTQSRSFIGSESQRFLAVNKGHLAFLLSCNPQKQCQRNVHSFLEDFFCLDSKKYRFFWLFFPWLPSWLDCGALNNVEARMLYVGGSRPDGAQVGGYSCTQRFPRRKGLLTSRCVPKSLDRVLIKEAIFV